MVFCCSNSPNLIIFFFFCFIIKGNEEGLFGIIHNRENKEVFVVNKYQIKGPKKFHIVMVTDVKHTGRGTTRIWKHEYHIFISVSEHGFSSHSPVSQ